MGLVHRSTTVQTGPKPDQLERQGTRVFKPVNERLALGRRQHNMHRPLSGRHELVKPSGETTLLKQV